MFDQDTPVTGRPRVCRPPAWLIATGVTLALGVSAIPANASAAATLTPDKACYVNDDYTTGTPMVITGTGFIPGDTVELAGTAVATTATAQPDGSVTFPATAAPTLSTAEPGTLRTLLTATDRNYRTGQTITAQTVVTSANLSVSTSPSEVKNLHKDKVRFRFSGFAPGKPIYGFYARKRIVAKYRFGKARGACGTLSKRALLFPGGHPHKLTYTVSFESRKKYSKTAAPRITAKLDVFRL